jgi:hypothetical protein
MRKIIFSSIIILLVISCSKDEEYNIRELNLAFKLTEAEQNAYTDPRITIYPNPFSTRVIIDIGTSANAEILINDDQGDYKRITLTNSSAVQIDFSKENSGVYYCEIINNSEVYRTYLIKQ